MGTALARHQSQPDIAEKVRAYAMTAHTVDGMDVLAVEVANEARGRAVRQGNGPCFLEYRNLPLSVPTHV
ncbi:MAG: thiamine pyrophosphate-dependent enzyme [Nitrospira sp.]|nr:thiamine pyrophosphate-dependent enzyme [Nitrospira sp.]